MDPLNTNSNKLGFGLMRLPKLPETGETDVEQLKKMVDVFMAGGGTYFDTAYVYDNGGSERAIKEALVDRYPRDSYTLATKLNAWLGMPDETKAKEEIHISLERTGAGYFDYYLLHAVQDNNIKVYDEFKLWDYVKELKEQGLIKHWGFSFHGSSELLERLLNEHPDAEFVQLQINYLDWEDKKVASHRNYDIVRSHGKPIVVMEPVKGGVLAKMPDVVEEVFRKYDPVASDASWAIRYVASKEGILAVLSGMSSIEQMEDNMSYMREFKPLTEGEAAVIDEALEAFATIDSIKCTACRYCTEGCPMNISIPDIFNARNTELVFKNHEAAKRGYGFATRGGGKASDCIECGQCEGACPQSLPIISLLKECAASLED